MRIDGSAKLIGFAITVTVPLMVVLAMWPEVGLTVFSAFVSIAIVKWMPPGGPLWMKFVFLVIAGSLLFGQGFSNFTLGYDRMRVPVTELAMFVSLLFISHTQVVRRFFNEPMFLLLAIVATVPLIIHIVGDIGRHGITAARDAIHHVDMIFAYVGYSVGLLMARRGDSVIDLTRWLIPLFVIGSMYILTYRHAEILHQISPQSVGYRNELPIFGFYNMVNNLALSALFFFVLFYDFRHQAGRLLNFPILLMVCALSLVGLAIMQTRAILVGALVGAILVAVVGKTKYAMYMGAGLFAMIVVLLVADISQLKLEGKLGEVSVDTFGQMVLSIFAQGDLTSPSHGVLLRLNWWSELLEEAFSSIKNVMIGQGFGIPLIHFTAPLLGETVQVRQPHNSFLTMLGQSGLPIVMAWIAYKVLLYRTLWLGYQRLDNSRPHLAAFSLWTLLFLAFIDIRSLVEPMFEFPYGAVPYYFFGALTVALLSTEQANATPRIDRRSH